MRGPWARAGLLAALVATLPVAPSAVADDGNVARSTDAVAKEREKEYEDLQKKDTSAAPGKRVEILRGLAFAPCNTARRFLLGVFQRPKAPGDERIEAMRSLLVMAEESTLEQVLATLAREKDATLWQAFSEALTNRPSDAVQAWMAGPGLQAPQSDAIGACLEALYARPVPATAERVAALYAKHAKPTGDGDLACRAMRILVRAGGPTGRALLLECARHADARLRLKTAEILPFLEPFDAECEAAVRGLLQDESATVRQVAALNAGHAKRSGLAAALIGLLADPRPRTRHVAARALARIAGKDLGHDPKAWAAWLENRDPGKPEEVTVATYHGVRVHSDRVLFLVDASASMTWPWRKPVHRIDVARAELASTLKKLTPDVLFNVVAYAEKVVPWKKTEVAATPDAVAAAIAWADKALADPKGDTHLYEALDWAYANDPQFDTLFLLTDGNPTAGRYFGRGALLSAVRARNRYRRTAVNCIGLSLASEDPGMPNLTEDLPLMRSLLQSLSEATGGEFREVLQAPAAR
jgi:hypothetical protein